MSADLPRHPPGRRRGRSAALRRRLAWRRRSIRRSPLATIRTGRGGRRKRWPRRFLFGSIALVALLIVATVGAVVYSVVRLDEIHRVHVTGLTAIPPGRAFDILLVGTDAAGDIDPVTAAADQTKPQLAALVVARIDPTSRQARLLAIPLETEVEIPGNPSGGPGPIGTAFSGGPGPLVATIEQSFHIPISEYAALNFGGLASIVGALGGIHLDFRYPLRDSYSGLSVSSAGCQLVDGAQAQALVRSDHLYYFSGGDWRAENIPTFGRVQRQQATLRAILSGAKSTVTNPIALNDLLTSVVANLTVNDSLSNSRVLYLAQVLRGLAPDDLAMTTLPTVPYTTRSGAVVLGPAPAADTRAIDAFLSFGGAPTDLGFGTRVTTVPGEPKVTRAAVISNTASFAWNPTAC